jgi:hypothetical protein
MPPPSLALSRTEVLQEAEYRRCRDDFEYFTENFWFVLHPEEGAVLFRMRWYQKEGARAFQEHRQVITLKARQIGWTTLCAAYSFWCAFFHENRTILFLSKKEDDARYILRMVRFGYDRLPSWIKDRGPSSLADNLQSMPFSNGSTIESHPSKSNPARGRTAYLVILDEWAFLENPEDAWSSIQPVIDIGGRMIGLSTANGVGNIFHELWERSVAGTANFKHLFYAWDVVPERDDAWYEHQKRDFMDWQLHQEYPRTPEEAFIRSGNMVFDPEVLLRIEQEDILAPKEQGLLLGMDGGGYTLEWAGVELSIWERPDLEHDYVLGADVSEGLVHGDFSCAYVLDLNTGHIVAAWHGKTDPDLFGDKINDLGRYYWTALLGVEANNHGLTTLTRLRTLHYPRLYTQRDYGRVGNQASDRLGWLTTRINKPLLVGELALAMRTGDLMIPCADALRELKTFTRDERGRMSGSPFDDRVIALGIANQMRKHAHVFPKKRERAAYWTIDWWKDQAKRARESSQAGPIGSTNVRQKQSSEH